MDVARPIVTRRIITEHGEFQGLQPPSPRSGGLPASARVLPPFSCGLEDFLCPPTCPSPSPSL